MGSDIGSEIVVEFRSHSAWNVTCFQLHDYYEINLALMDAGKFFLEDHVYQLRRGTVLNINNYLLHRNMSTDLNYQRCVIKFPPDIVQKFSTAQTDILSCFHKSDPMLQLNENQISQILQLIQQLISAKDSHVFGSDILQQVFLAEILVFLNQIAQTASSHIAHDLFPGTEKLSPILKYINDNIAEPLSLSKIAAQFFISKSYLCHIFKTSIGLTVNEYILHRRILVAKQLIDSNLSLLEICNQCGFNSYTSFARCFKKVTGFAPKKYRNKVLQERSDLTHGILLR